MFSCEFCKICKNTFFTEHLRCLLLFMVLHNPVTFQILPTLGDQVQNWCCVVCTTLLCLNLARLSNHAAVKLPAVFPEKNMGEILTWFVLEHIFKFSWHNFKANLNQLCLAVCFICCFLWILLISLFYSLCNGWSRNIFPLLPKMICFLQIFCVHFFQRDSRQ